MSDERQFAYPYEEDDTEDMEISYTQSLDAQFSSSNDLMNENDRAGSEEDGEESGLSDDDLNAALDHYGIGSSYEDIIPMEEDEYPDVKKSSSNIEDHFESQQIYPTIKGRKQSIRLRSTRNSFSAMKKKPNVAASMPPASTPNSLLFGSPHASIQTSRPRRTSFKSQSNNIRRTNLVLQPNRRHSGGQRSSGGSGGSASSAKNTNRVKSYMRSGSATESIRSSGTTHNSGEKLSEGGMSMLRRLLKRGTTPGNAHYRWSRNSDENFSDIGMDNNEALEYIARRTEDDNMNMDTAAAQLVAAGMSGSQYQYRFGANEYVLVSLEVMNQSALPELISRDPNLRNALNGKEIPNETLDDDILAKVKELDDKFTLEPVNRFGFPAGQGSKVEEQRGPYLYVLAKVKMVHFEEDARYYTVTRCDTNLDQRADSEWMWGEPITSDKGLEAALNAAKQNSKEKAKQNANRSRSQNAAARKSRFENFIETFVVTPFSKFQVAARHQITLFLLGLSPYSLEIRCTGVNLLVCCSFLFMFLDQIRVAFVPPEMDRPIVILNTIIWVVLVLELMFEVLIRPEGYSILMKSEKKYNPTTARFLNNFHLVSESLALLFFIPEMRCIFLPGNKCSEALPGTVLEATLKKYYGPTKTDVFESLLIFGILRLRIFGLVRHFKQMWLTKNIVGGDIVKKTRYRFARIGDETEITDVLLQERQRLIKANAKRKKADDTMSSIISHDKEDYHKKVPTDEEDRRLNDAANIGTALIVVNSHRAMILLIISVGLLPFVTLFQEHGGSSPKAHTLAAQLQAVNERLPGKSLSECTFLEKSIDDWIISTYEKDRTNQKHPIIWARLLPIRCDFQVPTNGIITTCNKNWTFLGENECKEWENLSVDITKSELAESSGIRVGNIHMENLTDSTNVYSVLAYTDNSSNFIIINVQSILLQFFVLLEILIGLSILKNDAGRLVLDPLRRMIKIVLHYAKNPLAPAPQWQKKKRSKKTGDDSDELGNFETEQLITAVTKITDLLRKCWGVAGAGIISSNLARTQSGKTVVFNPLVPGKLVYALFGFCGIMDFAYLLHALDKSVIELINDVAKVVHDEVFRWGLGSRGQCNKNLGGAFLMVHRIGDFKEVHEKKNRATSVIFDQKQAQTNNTDRTTLRRSRSVGNQRKAIIVENHSKLPFETVELASLPGISSFTDRAVVGMLKSFAGIHRDRNLLKWRDDFRLGAGVGAFAVNMIFGIDAGWGVEGAVGSEHKIDATYLSPHVNMAARMMSATKQFGVHLLLSQAAAELLSSEAKSKMRHIDTVSVKGSSVEQKIFTYDAKYLGVDFFLDAKSDRLADVDSERFTPSCWNTDRDLLAMRQHVSLEFINEFNIGRDFYLSGDWERAMTSLKKANNIMITTMLEEGCVEYEVGDLDERLLNENDNDEEVVRLRKKLGDGPSMCLISYMQNRGGVAPKGWQGYRPLTSK